jgi:YfiH family protein
MIPAVNRERAASGAWVWRDRRLGVEVRFVGRGAAGGIEGTAEEVLRRVVDAPPPLAWAKQIHSARVLAAQPGACGEGDALHTPHRDLALSIITADCVPVLLAGPEGAAAVHAGWRGLASRVIGATLAALPGDLSSWTAWIGPAIGPCCYEVSPEIAEQVAAASSAACIVPGKGEKPHLDLPSAARRQLENGGVGEIVTVERCTRCHDDLWSYRRDGRAGRNHAFIWKS